MLRLVDQGRLTAVGSVALVLEYEAVLSRPKHRRAAGIGAGEAERFLVNLVRLLEPATPKYSWRPALSDPDDEMVLEAAIAGGAQAIVTFNRSDYLPGVNRFGIDALSPGDVLRRLRWPR